MIKYPLIFSAFLLCGCIPYAYPSLVMTAPLNVAEFAEEVHAFRVDVSSKYGQPCYHTEEFSLTAIPLIAGRVPPQVKAGFDKGIIIIGVALNYHFHYHDGVRVRLYRPGYEIVEFDSWQFGNRIKWTPVTEMAGQKEAIDRLLRRPGSNDASEPSCLRPGSFSDEHRRALQFAAGEYDRLATFAKCNTLRQQLQLAADCARAQAEK